MQQNSPQPPFCVVFAFRHVATLLSVYILLSSGVATDTYRACLVVFRCRGARFGRTAVAAMLGGYHHQTSTANSQVRNFLRCPLNPRVLGHWPKLRNRWISPEYQSSGTSHVLVSWG
uniref:Putative secreted protein n=1 Tax=Ixodes ricinus TaxID=34613 RepID=A0A6B0UMN7_IXORI